MHRMEVIRYRRDRRGQLNSMALNDIVTELFRAVGFQNVKHSKGILVDAVLAIECPLDMEIKAHPVERRTNV
jgi:hypothetical protein